MTARARQGLRINVQPVDSGLVLDVADFIVYSGMELESLPMMLGTADLGFFYLDVLYGQTLSPDRLNENFSARSIRSSWASAPELDGLSSELRLKAMLKRMNLPA